ncbi:hypothetical protein LLB_2555 [Legionella longbeachae D-4968]|nr:hypothetical protein LLB_2555 [Legionella longbeachae D-4968]
MKFSRSWHVIFTCFERFIVWVACPAYDCGKRLYELHF